MHTFRSGLDSFQAQSVMESMKLLSKNGRLVISVIHQPRSSIFDMFDRLLLLSEGHSMFLGTALAASKHFSAAGFAIPRLYNPSDFFLDVLSPDNRSAELEKQTVERIARLGDLWAQEASNMDFSIFGTEGVDVSSTEGGWEDFSHPPGAESFDFIRFSRNFKLLLWRSFTEQTRDLPTIFIKVGMTCFFAFLIGGIYSNVGYNQKSISNRTGLLFIVCINQGFNGVLGVLNTFPKEKVG